jgi:hypothetical protein
MTTDQILAGTKTVTRRIGWKFVKKGDLLLPVKKCMGLKAGEKHSVLREPIRVTEARQERLDRMLLDMDYGFDECAKEGFGRHPTYCWPSEFVRMFCSMNPCSLEQVITRIEFEYT